MRLHILIACGLLWLTTGCGGDPEASSGADAYRHQAAAMPLDEWVTDDVAPEDGDRTDWRFIELESGGRLTVQFHADDKSTAVRLAVYDRYGQVLGTANHPAGRTEPVTFEVKAPAAGRYFIQVQATGGASSSYTLRATQGEADKGGGSTTPDF